MAFVEEQLLMKLKKNEKELTKVSFKIRKKWKTHLALLESNLVLP